MKTSKQIEAEVRMDNCGDEAWLNITIPIIENTGPDNEVASEAAYFDFLET